MDKEKLAKAFNEWMQKYINHPEEFMREWQTVTEFMDQKENGQEPSYGESAAKYLLHLLVQ